MKRGLAMLVAIAVVLVILLLQAKTPPSHQATAAPVYFSALAPVEATMGQP